MRKGGLEPPRYCYRQPLKLVRLPIPPLPQVVAASGDAGYFGVVGAGAGVTGATGAGAGPFTPLSTDPVPCWP